MAIKHIKIIAAAAILLAVPLAYLALSGGDERAVRRQFHALVRDCEKESGQGVLRSLTNTGDLRNYFTSNATIQLGRPYPYSPTPREISALVARAHMEVESLRIEIHGIEFLPRAERNVIDMRTAAEVIARRGNDEENYLDEYRLRWRKVDGKWLIESAQADSTIRAADL